MFTRLQRESIAVTLNMLSAQEAHKLAKALGIPDKGDEEVETCRGCGSECGEGYTENCTDDMGCGFFKTECKGDETPCPTEGCKRVTYASDITGQTLPCFACYIAQGLTD